MGRSVVMISGEVVDTKFMSLFIVTGMMSREGQLDSKISLSQKLYSLARFSLRRGLPFSGFSLV